MNAQLAICIPTFNRADHLRACLEGFLPQVAPHQIAIYVSDNGSSDNTAAVVEEFRRIKYPLVFYRSSPSNEGIDRNIVSVVEMATARYAWLFGDDDLPVPGAVAKVLTYLDQGASLVVVNASTYNADMSEAVEARRVDIREDRVYQPGDHNQLMRDVASYITYLGGLVVETASWRTVDPTPFLGSDYVHVSVVLRYAVGRRAVLCAEPQIKLRLQRQTWFSRYFEVEMVNWPRAVWGAPPEHYSDSAKQSVCDQKPTASLRRIMATRAYGQYDRRAYDAHVAPDADIPGWRKRIFRGIAMLPASWFRLAFVAYLHGRRLLQPTRYTLALFRLRETSRW